MERELCGIGCSFDVIPKHATRLMHAVPRPVLEPLRNALCETRLASILIVNDQLVRTIDSFSTFLHSLFRVQIFHPETSECDEWRGSTGFHGED